MSIDLSKSYEYFQPEKYDEPIHIVGTGSVGLTVAELLVRSGLTNLVLWDFDKVEPHNLANQMFRQQDVGKLKVEAAKDILMEINPDVKDIKLRKNGWNGQNMSGFIFLAVDSIELRKKIVEQHFDSPYVKAVFDFRTGLEDAQSFAADWNNQKMKEALLATMQFTDEEANKQNPVSACNVSLAVAPTIRVICSLGVANFMNYWNDKELKKIIVCNPYIPAIEAY